jgi:hypothetical protein
MALSENHRRGFVLDALCSHAGPIECVGGCECRCTLRLGHRTFPPSVPRAPPLLREFTAESRTLGSFTLTRTSSVGRSPIAGLRAKVKRPAPSCGSASSEASKLHHRAGGHWYPREVKSEDASPVRQIARIDPAIVRFDGPSAEGKAQAQASAIGAVLFERAE